MKESYSVRWEVWMKTVSLVSSIVGSIFKTAIGMTSEMGTERVTFLWLAADRRKVERVGKGHSSMQLFCSVCTIFGLDSHAHF